MYIYININIISFKRVYFSADTDEYIDLTDCLNAIFNSYGVTMLNCIFYYNTVDTREVIGMAFEVIKNIVEAENEVDSIKAAAAADAQKIKADAKAKADTLIADVKRSAKADEKAAVEEAIKNAQPQVESILSHAEKVCKEVKLSAEKNRQPALEAVIGKVVGINGHS